MSAGEGNSEKGTYVQEREEDTGGWRKLHNKDPHDLQYSLIIMYISY